MAETINRETSWKGQRLQKLRLTKLLLDAIEKNNKCQIYGAVEFGQDVYTNNRNEKTLPIKFEENKNYADSKFSFNSHEVINTLVSFIDIWINNEYSSNIGFGFYTTADISKESNTELIKTNSITLPDKPILELFSTSNYDYLNLKESCIALLKLEYERQYLTKTIKGNLLTIKALSDNEYLNFFKLIDWSFGDTDEIALKGIILTSIRNSRLFNDRMIGKEETVFSLIGEAIEEKQGFTDPIEKFIHASEIELIFKRAETGIENLKPEDPVWKMWNNLTPSDKRNIKDKIDAVCTNFPKDKIEIIARKVSRSLIEKESASDNTFLSVRYRIYEECEDEIVTVISSGAKLTEDQIDEFVKKLTTKCLTRIESLSSIWAYKYKDEKVVQGIILELFDSCFLAFDKA